MCLLNKYYRNCGGHHDSDHIAVLVMVSKAESIVLYLSSCIYTIICLKSVCLATFAQCSSQFWLNRVGRCLKLIASTRGTFCHEFVSQFGLDFFYTPTNRKPLSPAYFDPRCGDKQRNLRRQNRGNSVV